MSTTDSPAEGGTFARRAMPSAFAEALPRFETPIVPQATISGRALVAVVAIMTFLASLTTGAVMLVRAAANEWQAEVAREVTIQVRPAAGRDIEAGYRQGCRRRPRGVRRRRTCGPIPRRKPARLLEPWLGTGLPLDDLPVPRIIVVRIASGAAPDLCAIAPDARRAGSCREPRRPSQLRRSHARHVERRARRRHRRAHARPGRHRALGHLRDPRRHGDQPSGDRGAAFHRRQGQVHRRDTSSGISCNWD